ncbi:hypothetical protein ACFL27_23935 [candidate division CSSED10-310 bacterium]|uniref:DUF3887 domain-containing protein n=1 Tax=candidate division CSSED10-310 bacterium TaxID=2855610 RepID=A0ABV6Z498_UNCC1
MNEQKIIAQIFDTLEREQERVDNRDALYETLIELFPELSKDRFDDLFQQAQQELDSQSKREAKLKKIKILCLASLLVIFCLILVLVIRNSISPKLDMNSIKQEIYAQLKKSDQEEIKPFMNGLSSDEMKFAVTDRKLSDGMIEGNIGFQYRDFYIKTTVYLGINEAHYYYVKKIDFKKLQFAVDQTVLKHKILEILQDETLLRGEFDTTTLEIGQIQTDGPQNLEIGKIFKETFSAVEITLTGRIIERDTFFDDEVHFQMRLFYKLRSDGQLLFHSAKVLSITEQ